MKKLRNMRKSDLIYDRLADRISMMADGDPFPSVRELMTEFEASQFSVLPAVKKLQKQGFLKSYIGRGSFVCRRAREQQAKLVLLTSDWPSYGNAEFDRLFLAEAGRRNHRVRVVHYPFASDVYSMLDEIRGADAILLEPLRIDSFTAEQLRSILQAPAPVIVCRAEIPINGIRYVAGNAMMAGSVTANYLHSMGHRRIGILWTEPHNRTMRDLVDGFRTYARFNGLETELLDCATEYGENALDNTRAFLHRYLAEVPVLPFSALFVVSDETAVAALDALEAEGIRVPQELSVIGQGMIDIPGRYRGRLTSVGHPLETIVSRALEIIDTLQKGGFQKETQIKIDPVVFEGATVKPFSEIPVVQH